MSQEILDQLGKIDLVVNFKCIEDSFMIFVVDSLCIVKRKEFSRKNCYFIRIQLFNVVAYQIMEICMLLFVKFSFYIVSICANWFSLWWPHSFPLEAHSIHFGPIQSTSVLFGLVWSYLVQFDPIRSFATRFLFFIFYFYNF